MEQEKATVDELAENIRLVKEEIRVLQVAAVSQKTSWYRNISTWISILALLLSFGVAYFSYLRAKAQDIQNTRVELRGLLQRLSALSKEYYEVPQKYQHDPNAIGTVQSSIGQESALLSSQAAELARTLPRNQVSATEWYSIALALEQDLNYELAKEFMGYAIESAKTLTEKTATLRGNARLMFITGKSESGRVEYQKAVGIFSEFKGYDDDDIRNRTHLSTYLSWAYAEANAGFKEEANQCLAKAESCLSKLRPGPDTEQWRVDIDEAKKRMNFTGEVTNPSLKATHDVGVKNVLGSKFATSPKLKPESKKPMNKPRLVSKRQPELPKRPKARQASRKRRR